MDVALVDLDLGVDADAGGGAPERNGNPAESRYRQEYTESDISAPGRPTPSAYTAPMLELSNAFGRVSADPQGAQVLAWDKRVGQAWVPVLYAGESRKRTGIPVLFPYFGALKDGLVAATGKLLGQHGFARDCLWKERRVSATEGFFELTDRDIPDTARAAYPWPFLARLTLELTDAGDLRVTLHVRNTGDRPLPIAPGLHPYFLVPHADKRHISARLDGAGGPVPDFGAVDWDTDTSTRFIAWGSPLSVKFPDGRVLRIAEESKRPGFPWLAVWSGGAGDYLCVEPAAGLPDALNAAPVLVAPGETWGKRVVFGVR